MKAHVGCLQTRALIQYVKSRHPENLHLLWAGLRSELPEGEDPERFLGNPRCRIGIEAFKTVMEQTKRAAKDEMAVFKAALADGRRQNGILLGAGFFRRSVGPQQVIQRARASAILTGKETEVLSSGETSAIVRLHWPREASLNRDFCSFSKGVFQGAPTAFQLPPARLWERACFFDGGPFCEYQLWWDRKPGRRIWRLTGLFEEKGRKGLLKREAAPVQDEAPQPALEEDAGQVPAESSIPSGEQVVPEPAEAPVPGRQPGKATEAVAVAEPSRETSEGAETGCERPPEHQQEPEASAVQEAPRTAKSPAQEAVVRQLGHLLGGMGKMVSMMLSETDRSHPYFDHLQGMGKMIRKGEELKDRLLNQQEGGSEKVPSETLETTPLPLEQRTLPAGVVKGQETVLLVDDEAMLLDVGRQMLEALGYQVLAALDGKTAVEVYEQNRSRIALVIMDMVMPHMGGREALAALRKIDPRVRVLLCSGYTAGNGRADWASEGFQGFVQKPFSMGQLSRKIREILDGPGP